MMATDRRQIWVTRSQPGARQLADQLIRAGLSVWVCPLLEIHGSSDPTLEQLAGELDQIDCVIAVSGHAVRFGLPRLKRRWPQMPSALDWVAVGPATAEALAGFGIAAVVAGRPDSEGILALDVLQAAAGRRVMLLCGVGGRNLLDATLTERGAVVTRFEAYRREPVTDLDLTPERVGLALVASVAAGRALAGAWFDAGGDDRLELIAGSVRIADALGDLGFARVRTAAGPTDQDMLDAVVDWAASSEPNRPEGQS